MQKRTCENKLPFNHRFLLKLIATKFIRIIVEEQHDKDRYLIIEPHIISPNMFSNSTLTSIVHKYTNIY